MKIFQSENVLLNERKELIFVWILDNNGRLTDDKIIIRKVGRNNLLEIIFSILLVYYWIFFFFNIESMAY